MPKTNQTSETRIPPQNVEAEQSVLGSLMLDKEAVFRIVDFLAPEDFYKSANKTIYQAMLELFEKREPIDILSMTNILKENKALDEIGGSSYLTTLVNSVPTASHIVHYAQIISRKKILRDLIDASYHIAQLGYKEAENIDELVDEAEQKIFGIAKKSFKKDFLLIKEALEEAWERIDRLHKGDGDLRGVSTGFPDLDNKLAGLQKSDLIVLAARPSLGKTSLALNIARNIAVEGKKPVGFFSLEMSRDQVVDRLIATEAGVDLWQLRTGKLSSEGPQNDFSRIRDAMENLTNAPIFIDDSPSPSVMQLRAMARRLQAEHDIGLLVIDYLQLIKGEDRTENRVQEVSQISRSLKALAKELNVPVLAISQLSRGVEMRSPAIPKLSDLRESGSIEQDADVVMFIYREDKDKKNSDKKNIAEIFIEKHRSGPTGKVELYFDERQATFKSLAKNFDEPFI